MLTFAMTLQGCGQPDGLAPREANEDEATSTSTYRAGQVRGGVPVNPGIDTEPRRRRREAEGRNESRVARDVVTRYQREMIEGAAALYSGRFDAARRHYLEAMALRPRKMAAALGALRSLGVRGHGEARSGTEAVVRKRIKSLKTKPASAGAAHLLEARMALALNRPRDAMAHARAAVERLPTLGVSWRVLGEAAMASERWAYALENLQRGVSLGLAARAGTWERIAHVQDELGQPEEAERAARRAVELTGDDRHALRRRLNLLGVVQKHAGQLEQAEASFGEALKLGAKDPAVLHNIAGLLEAQGKALEALAHYQLALEQSPSPMTQWRLGHALLKLDNPQEALNTFRLAAGQLDRWTWPPSTRWWPAYDVGKLFAKSGLNDAAVPWFEDALRHTQTTDALREVQSWLSFSEVQVAPTPSEETRE